MGLTLSTPAIFVGMWGSLYLAIEGIPPLLGMLLGTHKASLPSVPSLPSRPSRPSRPTHDNDPEQEEEACSGRLVTTHNGYTWKVDKNIPRPPIDAQIPDTTCNWTSDCNDADVVGVPCDYNAPKAKQSLCVSKPL